ncbi:hypothetical protein ACHWQZ_G005314 [Mnemiopsis leidyi]
MIVRDRATGLNPCASGANLPPIGPNRGVYSETKCYKPNHAVAIVGYGTLNGVPYWKIRNSWSRGWGEGGYMKIKRKGNMCAIEQYAHYPVIFREGPKTGSTTEEEVEREE